MTRHKAALTIMPDYDTLVKLFGGEDGEVNVAVQRSIAEAFAKNHLKALINEQPMQDAIKAIQAGIEQEIKQQIGTVKRDYQQNVTEVKLSAELIDRVKHEVATRLDKLISDRIAEYLVNSPDLNALLLERAEQVVAARIDARIEKMLDSQMKLRLAQAARLLEKNKQEWDSIEL